MKPLLAVALLVAPVAACRAPAQAPPAPLYALLPLQNLGADPDVASVLTARLRGVLEQRGARFVPEDELEAVLRARRIRHVDSLSPAAARAIAEGTGASHLLLGTLMAYRPEVPPRIVLSLRVLSSVDGRKQQSALVALAGDDFTGLLGLGEVRDPDVLAWEVVARAADMFDARGLPRAIVADAQRLAEERPRRPLLRFVDDSVELGPGTRVAVLPFANRSSLPLAAQLFVDVLAHAWLQALGVEVIETGELYEAFARARVRSIDRIDSTALGEVARSVGARYLVLGSVEAFDPEVPEDGELHPQLEVWLRMVDARDGRLVAGAALRRSGAEYRSVLGLGSERDPVRLALRTARALLATLSS